MASRATYPERHRGASAARSALRSTGLPLPPNPLIGREREIAAIDHVLGSGGVRLLTLTGPPGVGKTRLAVAAAESAASRFADGVVHVDLASVRSADTVLAEVARAVGLGPSPGQQMATRLVSWLSDKNLLLVVDNFEHVLPAAADVAALLGRDRDLSLLVTSRERLHVAAEYEFPVPPLPMPRREDVIDLRALVLNPSLALLVERARALIPDFAVTGDNAEALVEICIRLDGMPLAIELAAARLKVFPPPELLDRLRDHLALLTGGASDTPPRHRTLRAAIEWSHDLLPDSEQALFRQTSVFVGGWTLAAAEQVCGENGMDVLDTTSSLLDKSLIRRRTRPDGIVEFSMTEGVREYAAERLAAHAEATTVRSRHATHFAAEAKQAERGVGTADETRVSEWVGYEQGNLVAALDYCLRSGNIGQALHLAAALGWYWYLRGRIGESESTLEQVLTLADAAVNPVPTDALAGVLLTAGVLAWSRGDSPRSRALLERCAALTRPIGDERRLATAEAFLGHVARTELRYDEAAMRHHRASELFERTGNRRGVMWSQYDLALLARDRGQLATARTLFAAALRDFRDIDYPWAVATSACGLGHVDVQLGEVDEAAPLLVESLDFQLEFDDSRGVAQCLEALAALACARSRYQTSARLLAAAAGLRAALAVPLPKAEAAAVQRVEEALARVVEPRSLDRARHDGRTMPITAAVDLAKSVGNDQLMPRRPDPPLTSREHQVAALVATGNTNRQVARSLGIAEKTAEAHVYNIMGKLGAHSRAEVATWATAEGLLQERRVSDDSRVSDDTGRRMSGR
jgi:predicted ATPase/DNA-binding NarL/FixJ family response regulator